MNRNNKKGFMANLALFCILIFVLTAVLMAGRQLIGRVLTIENIIKTALPIASDQDADGAMHEDALAVTAEPYQGDDSGATISYEILEIEAGVGDEIKFELLSTKSKPMNLSGKDPRILIYHTHTSEAYTATAKMPYEETTEWRTDDQEKNIVRVGDEIAKQLKEKYGLAVIHDKTDHEPPKLGTAYERSLETMKKYAEKYPSIELFIDVHRDAYMLKEGEENTDFISIDGKKCAKVMFVVGTGEGQTGAGFKEKPNYKENYALALAISEKLKGINEKFARPIRIKPGRYNQHIGKRALLIEMGHNANTLEEVLASVPHVAKAIAMAVNDDGADAP